MFEIRISAVRSTDMSLLLPDTSLPCLEEQTQEEDLHIVKRIPFSSSSANIQKTNKSTKKSTAKDKENQTALENMPPSKQKSRKFTKEAEKESSNRNMFDEDSLGTESSTKRSATPTCDDEESVQPLTPTANLKMLFSAVSPELRNREKKKELFAAGEGEDDQFQSLKPLNLDSELAASQAEEASEGVWKPGSRKEKSLGLLCQKFLQKYNEYPQPHENTEISLDEVAKELAVERRRIYDIVNVLESVELVSRIAKNKYAWHGKTNLVTTLAKLKALGEAEGFSEQIEKVKDYELNRALEIQNGLQSSQQDLELENPGLALLRKDKSLGIMSQKFLMLFLVSKTKMVNLDLAAKILIGDPNIDKTENAKFKTKIRRLYDIANILATLNLIRKIRITEIRDRKPTYQYIGPDLDQLRDLNVCYNDGYHRPSSRHSMLDCVKNTQVVDILTPSGQSTLRPASCEPGGLSSQPTGIKKGGLPRHSSFEQICQVAEEERSKLYASMSLPASPTSEKQYDDFPKSLSQEERITVTTLSRNGEELKGKKIVLMQKSKVQSFLKNLPILPKSSETEEKVIKLKPVAIQPKQAATNSVTGKVTTVEQIIVKSGSKKSQTTVAPPLTKDQIDAVLKSLKVPVPMKKSEEQTEGGGEKLEVEKAQNETIPIVESKRSSANIDIEPSAKRFKSQFPSPPTDDESKEQKSNVVSILHGVNKGKPSPQRALIPDFLNTQSPAQSQVFPSSQSIPALGEDLALSFIENDDSCDSLPIGNVMQKASNMHSIAVQLPNQQPTILQFPVLQMQSQSRESTTLPNQSHLPQSVQVLQGVPVSATGFTGQPINFIVPVTFSPPLTPQTPSSGHASFSFPNQQQNTNYSSVQYVCQPTSSPVSSISNISTMVGGNAQPIPQLVTPTERPLPPPSKFFGNTPGGLIPLATVAAVGNGKESFSTARKLDLPDISA